MKEKERERKKLMIAAICEYIYIHTYNNNNNYKKNSIKMRTKQKRDILNRSKLFIQKKYIEEWLLILRIRSRIAGLMHRQYVCIYSTKPLPNIVFFFLLISKT